ncbi:MAG: OsmC family protein [Promethearchaeota archaeon]
MHPDEVVSHEFKVAITWPGEYPGNIGFKDRAGLSLSSPPEFGGQAGSYTPQELFVSSIASCYLTTFTFFLNRMKLSVDSLTMEGCGVVEQVPEGGWRFREVMVTMNIRLTNADATAKISRAIELSEKYCMVTRSVSCSTRLEHTINGQKAPT